MNWLRSNNHISTICSTNFVLQDLGQPTREETFVFGLTYEEAWTHQSERHHVKKIRVLMVRESNLAKLKALDQTNMEFQSGRNYHIDRFNHLKILERHWTGEECRFAAERREAKAKGEPPPRREEGAYVGKLELCVPVGDAADGVARTASSKESGHSPWRSALASSTFSR